MATDRAKDIVALSTRWPDADVLMKNMGYQTFFSAVRYLFWRSYRAAMELY